MTQASPKLVGAFVVGGVALLIGGLLTFGSMQFLKSRIPVAMYFAEDLTGLDPGAPVTFRGVQIGTVTDIVLRFNPASKTFQSPVRIEIEPDRFQIEGVRPRATGDNMPYFVEQGLRARLASQSILTGKRLVELGFHPGTPARLVGTKSDIPEVPTIPSEMEALQAGLEGLLKKLEQTALPELVDDLRGAVKSLGALLAALDAGRFSEVADDASQTLRTGRQVLENIGSRIDTMAPKGEAAIDNADQLFQELQKAAKRAGPVLVKLQETAERANHLLADANELIEPGSQTHRDLTAMMREIAGAARSMRILTDDLERNPNSLLFGKASAKGR
jgi:paraquat-inducible protein B